MGTPRATPGTLWLGAALCAALAGPTLAGTAPPDPCAPWPGEPDPLPQLADADPVQARWAELRAAELAERAAALEEADPLEAHRLWLRFRCFDPGSPELRRALDRTRPVRVLRPELIQAGAGQEPPAVQGWSVLEQPLVLARPAPRPSRAQAERRRLLADLDRVLGAAEEGVRGARFEEALESAGEARERLARMAQGADLRDRWIRLELTEATAHVARGNEADARACAERALARQPGLDLDAHRHSPKLLRLFESARAGVRP